MENKDKVAAVRAWLAKEGFAALIVGSEDAHQSEYVADADRRREWVSGFSGSAGTAVISAKGAYLWTDGRYLLQAKQQCDPANWEVHQLVPRQSSLAAHLCGEIPANSKVAVDAWMLPLGASRLIGERLSKGGHALVPLKTSVVDALWTDQPSAPCSKVFIHPLSLASVTPQEKIAKVREALAKAGADALVVSSLDDIAWLLNIRAGDIPFNPVVISYCIIAPAEATSFYIDPAKLDEEVSKYLAGCGITVRPYQAIGEDLKALALAKTRVMVDPARCSWAVAQTLTDPHEVVEGGATRGGTASATIIEQLNPIQELKAIKTQEESDGLRAAHVRDAAALVSFIQWLEELMEKDDHPEIDEVSAADKLEWFRRQQEGFVSLSFDTISSYGANGAIIHYKPEVGTCAKLGKDSLYLVDSGAQYRDGTTDVTRTLHFSTPTPHMRDCYTRVLRGHIHLSAAIFPEGTTGHMLDILARGPLWAAGLDYKHGTGHGVGAFNCVHEGPQLISYYPRDPDPAIQLGMSSSIEPGYYEEGNFGIRIENVALVVEAKTEHNFNGQRFLTFDPITFVPLSAKLIEIELLTSDEIQWVDDYHEKCLAKVSPLLTGAPLEWLKASTRPLIHQIYGSDATDAQ
mmetsp:Transcript_17378/g.41867  ORF Transcript_17378/g.41867 Transcript_17378/m.41867 type:complete len:631 (-) Transcript_17378:75-1967(-)